jgi:2-methylcitrate dehydratase PrpD
MVEDRLGAYIARVPELPLPVAVRRKAREHLLDTLAAAISGTQLAAGRRATLYAGEQGGAPEATVIGSGLLANAAGAALANGMMCHADESDDSHAATITHPGCAVVPAALAMGEACNASGEQLLRAIVAGYDICARMIRALGARNLSVNARSPHAIGGGFGATAAAAAVARLDPRQVRHAFSYAVQQSAGATTWIRDPDHIEKAFVFGGMPARNGTSAVAMVRSGMTGVSDALTGSERNFFGGFGWPTDPSQLILELGERFEIMTASIKKWSVGSPIQAPLDAAAALLASEALVPDAIAEVIVELPPDSILVVDNRKMPDVCLQHLVATMLVDGGLSFSVVHDHARMTDPAVLALRERIRVVPNEELGRALPARGGIVTLVLHDGRRLRHRTDAVRGTVENPMTHDEIEAKAADLISPILGAAKAQRLIELVNALETLENVTALRPLLSQ